MILHLDQSIRWEATQADTVLAVATTSRPTIGATVLVPAAVKRACLQALREDGQRGTPAVLKLFSAALFLLLEPWALQADLVLIDMEYPGHERNIQGALVNHLRRRWPDYEAGRVTFGHVHKNSPAHGLALRAMKGKEAPGRVLTARELLALVGKKKDRGERH